MVSPTSCSETGKIGLLTIALGETYVNYWKTLIKSFLLVSGLAERSVIHIFTDRPDLVSLVAESSSEAEFRTYHIDSRPWPFATLDRFEIFDDHLSRLEQDVLLYLDADMEILAPLPAGVFREVEKDGVYFVQHPGYSRPRNLLKKFRLYARNWPLLTRDLTTTILHGGIGEWESRQESSSFTPRWKRKEYVCGGCWIAKREKAHDLIKEIADKTRADKEKGIIARWHDESHLNFFQSEYRFSTLSPSWCFVEGYRHLLDYEPLILAVDKGDLRTR